MVSDFHGIPSLWEPSEFVHFVVGKVETEPVSHTTTENAEVAEKCTFSVRRDVFVALCPVVEAAVTGNFSEGIRQEIHLPQFDPDDFQHFLRFAHAGAFCSPPHIDVVVSNHIVLRVVPIAAYLGATVLLKMMEKHVKEAPTFETIMVFEVANVSVDWNEAVLQVLFGNLTTETRSVSSFLYFSNNKSGYDGLSKATDVKYELRASARECMAQLTAPTLVQLVSYLTARLRTTVSK